MKAVICYAGNTQSRTLSRYGISTLRNLHHCRDNENQTDYLSYHVFAVNSLLLISLFWRCFVCRGSGISQLQLRGKQTIYCHQLRGKQTIYCHQLFAGMREGSAGYVHLLHQRPSGQVATQGSYNVFNLSSRSLKSSNRLRAQLVMTNH